MHIEVSTSLNCGAYFFFTFTYIFFKNAFKPIVRIKSDFSFNINFSGMVFIFFWQTWSLVQSYFQAGLVNRQSLSKKYEDRAS